MDYFVKKYLMVIISVCVLFGIFLYGYKISGEMIHGQELATIDIKNSCDLYEKDGVFIYKGNAFENKEAIKSLCETVRHIKSNGYNALSIYLISIDGTDPVPQIYFFIIPIIIILCCAYSLSYYLKNTSKKEIKDDKRSIKLMMNSYKNIMVFIIFVVLALIISFIMSGHIYYQDSFDIGLHIGLLDLLFYIIYVISVFGIFTNVALIVGRRNSNFIVNSILSIMICAIVISLIGLYLEISVPTFLIPMEVETKTLVLVILLFITTTHIVHDIYKDKNKLIEAKAIK